MKTVTLPQTLVEKIEKIADELQELKSEIESYEEKPSDELKFGSDEWWEQAEKEADEDTKAGRLKEFSSVKNLVHSLHEAARKSKNK